MMRFFVHTVGTSLLGNCLTDKRAILNQMTNIKDHTSLSNEQKAVLEQLNAFDISSQNRKKVSAELNAFYTYHEKYQSNKTTDIHYLIHTDTITGELSAKYVKKMMEDDDYKQVNLVKIDGLNTQDTLQFNQGIKNLFHWLNENMPTSNSHTEIIFNLTGGFKSLQGYMNTAGMLYADKIIYIFETNADLVEIDKLPIVLDKQTIESNAKNFLLAEVMGTVEAKFLEHIIPIYKQEIDDVAELSPIGLLAWLEFKKEILEQNLLSFDSLEYQPSFKDDFKDKKRDVVKLQEVLAKVSYLWQQNNGNIAVLKSDGGLQYENFKGKNADIGHFRVTQETRVSCVIRDGKLVLRHFGEHDYVNDNP